jgi:hypothetical protein
MKSILGILSIIILGAIVNLFAPWYLIALVAFVVAFAFAEKGFQAFTMGFVAVFILWLFTAIVKTWGNDGILVGRMGELIGVGGILLYLITAFIGAIVGGFSALTGYSFKTINAKKDNSVYYKVR